MPSRMDQGGSGIRDMWVGRAHMKGYMYVLNGDGTYSYARYFVGNSFWDSQDGMSSTSPLDIPLCGGPGSCLCGGHRIPSKSD